MPRVPVPKRGGHPPPATPEDLYDSLTVTDPAIGALWRHQSHVLGRYFEEHADARDVAIELPTGSGKTLVGLLIADWRRRARGGTSAFICPTRQLARQAHEKAQGYGVPTALLIGPSRDWDPMEETRGLTGEATIISVYAHIFNAGPKMSPNTLVLDDAHAAEGPVAKNWSVSIERSHAGYASLLSILEPVVPSGRFKELQDDALPPHSRPSPQLIGPSDLSSLEEEVTQNLREVLAEGEEASYSFSQLRGHLSGCLMYVGWQEILIRPFIPPTRFHAPFADAKQRVFLSATLGNAGELERSFGRIRIPRVETPSDWERRGSGRRLALLPRAGMLPGEATLFIREAISRFPRALVLVPSGRAVEDIGVFLPEGWAQLGKEDVDETFYPFQESKDAALILANRYDGIDLPGEQCEVILISGLPAGTHLQERFLVDVVDARSALRERIRTRLMQGMGRATRSRSDHAVILMAGEDLMTFLREPDNLAGLRPELQAELGYGIFLAQEDDVELSDVIDSFLARDEDWAGAEEYLREKADEADIEPPKGARQLQEAALSEVQACEAAWRGEPDQASAFAQAVVRRLSVGAVAAYRTLWKVLAAHWAAQHAASAGEAVDIRIAAELARDAKAASRLGSWRPPLPDVEPPSELEEVGSRAIRLASTTQRIARSPKADQYKQKMLDWIGSNRAVDFEQGIERMGEMLGFEAIRPNVSAAPDGAWRDGDSCLLWEAKSEQTPEGALSAEMVRQANTHSTWVVRELGWDPDAAAVTVVTSPRGTIDRNAHATVGDTVYLASIDAVRQMASEVADLWDALIAGAARLTLTEAAEQAAEQVSSRGLEAENLLIRLGARKMIDLPIDTTEG